MRAVGMGLYGGGWVWIALAAYQTWHWETWPIPVMWAVGILLILSGSVLANQKHQQ